MSLTAEIIAVGTELLLGDIVNTNAQVLSQGLASMGITVHFQSVVGDNPRRLLSVVKQAISRSNVIITTGGLGPTGDDLTKETICGALGMELRVDEERLKALKERFEKSGRQMTENNIKQVMFPEGGIILDNPNGTAPGLCIHQGNQFIFMLPGPPREMTPMFDKSVKPYLSQFTEEVIHSVSIEFFGIGESAMEAKLAHLMEAENPTVAPYAKQGQCKVRITAKAPDVAAARTMIAPVVRKIESIVGEYIYGYDGEELETVAVRLLKTAGLTVATAESCTGGLIAQRITSVPGCSEVFSTGFVTYSADAKMNQLNLEEKLVKKYGVVSPQAAAMMAVGAVVESGSDIGVSVTGIAGPDTLEDKPVGRVYVGLCAGKKVWVKELDLSHFSRDRDSIRHASSSNALDMLRRYADPDLRHTLDSICMDPETFDLRSASGTPSIRSGVVTSRKVDTFLLIMAFLVVALSLAYLAYSVYKQYGSLASLSSAKSVVATADRNGVSQFFGTSFTAVRGGSGVTFSIIG